MGAIFDDYPGSENATFSIRCRRICINPDEIKIILEKSQYSVIRVTSIIIIIFRNICRKNLFLFFWTRLGCRAPVSFHVT